MRRYLLLLGFAFARPLQAQFHFTHRDTLPQKVVQRALDGYNHHDVVAIEAEYQPTYLFQNLSGSAGPRLVSRVDMRDSLIVVFQRIKDARLTLSKRVLTGPIVTDFYVAKVNGRKQKHVDMYEVRHGKIVREWEY
ncbi:MAG TPA: hypothetical protein VFD67_13145 [Gemmatimonadaceae bacterium]|nr:hypothetical protein [Gemmatimonadaceae bacterium]